MTDACEFLTISLFILHFCGIYIILALTKMSVSYFVIYTHWKTYFCFSVWQHVDCMKIDRDNIPDEYLCEACDPRPIDRLQARALQIRRRQEIKAHLAR